VLAAAWLALAPRTADFAAQVYRTQLFSREGFTLWDNSWFAGHHLPGYSLLFPALASAFGPRLVATAAVMASATLFAHLVRDQGTGRRRAIAWFACVAAGDLFIGRLTFSVGVACALACLVAVQHGRPRIALALGALTAATSPVCALLVAIVLVAWMPPLERRWRLAVIAMPPAAAVLLALSFPEGGTQPYDTGAALVALGITIAVGLALPKTMLAARRGALLYAFAIIGAYVVASPMGSNISRLGVLAAGPLLILGFGARRPRPWLVTPVIAIAVILWQLWAPVTEVLKARRSPATNAAYFQPLLTQLSALPAGRVEVVPTSTRWESVYVARDVSLARGWETQLDHRYNGLFYEQRLTAAAYVRWLRRLGVSYVALSDAPTERWGKNEARLLRGPNTALPLVWHGRHWRLFAVPGTSSIVSRGRLVRLAPDVVSVALPAAGSTLIRVRYTRFWRAGAGACVSRAADGFTLLRVRRPGVYTLRAHFGVEALLGAADDGCTARRSGPA
jgi:hypothetical protein